MSDQVKKIALLINSSNYEHQKKTIQELHRVLKSHGGYALYVFTCYGLRVGWSKSSDQDYSIYDLVDNADFDGYIIEGKFGNNFELLYKVTEILRKKNVPIVGLNNSIADIPCVLYDSYGACSQIMEHLINVHYCKKINFDMNAINLDVDSDETMALQAYKDTLAKYDIPFEEKRVTNHPVSIKNGQDLYTQMRQEGIDDADALLSTHDVKAIGLCMEMEAHGKKIPKDMIICSTKRSTNSIVFRPDISGTDPNPAGGAEMAVKILEDLFEGKPVDPISVYPGNAVYGRSCGCCKQESEDQPYDYRQLILGKVEAGNQISRMMQYNSKLENVASFVELANNIREMLTGISCEQFIISINKWDLSPKDPAIDDDHESYYDSTMCSFSGSVTDIPTPYLEEYPTKNLIPLEPDSGDIAIFLPIIFKDHVYGYATFLNDYLPIVQYNYRVCHEAIGASIDALRNDLYIRTQWQSDPLTGLNNHFALKNFKALNASRRDYGIMMIDMDNLKPINDTYGHAVGNIAICIIAEAIKSRKYDLAIRYGGDEFVIVNMQTDPAFYDKEIEKIRSIISKSARKQLLPFDIGISIGYSISTSDNSLTYEEALEAADSAMYRNKRSRKEANRPQS